MQAFPCQRAHPKLKYFRNSGLSKLKLQFSKWTEVMKFRLLTKNGLYGSLTFLMIKWELILSVRLVHHIYKMRKIGESYHRVVQYPTFHPILEPRPLVCTTGVTERLECFLSGAWYPIKKHFTYLNLLVTSLYLSSFQNELPLSV